MSDFIKVINVVEWLFKIEIPILGFTLSIGAITISLILFSIAMFFISKIFGG